MSYYGNPDIITIPFPIYLLETEKYGHLQFIHNFRLAVKSSNKKDNLLLQPGH